MTKFATMEELLLVQEILDKFNYPHLLEFHLDDYWYLSLQNELWSGMYPSELDYCDKAKEGIRIAGDFAMVNVQLWTGVWITKVFSVDKMLEIYGD